MILIRSYSFYHWNERRWWEFKKGRNVEKCTSKCVEVTRGETLRLSSIVVWRRNRKSGSYGTTWKAGLPSSEIDSPLSLSLSLSLSLFFSLSPRVGRRAETKVLCGPRCSSTRYTAAIRTFLADKKARLPASCCTQPKGG